MKIVFRVFLCIVLACVITAQAQLAVTVSSPKVVGQKAVVELKMTNSFPEKIESACAVCFLLDEQGKMAGQTTKWVIGGTKDRPALPPKTGTTYNFVIIISSQPFMGTNLTAQVRFSRVVLDGGKLANVIKDVSVTAPSQH